MSPFQVGQFGVSVDEEEITPSPLVPLDNSTESSAELLERLPLPVILEYVLKHASRVNWMEFIPHSVISTLSSKGMQPKEFRTIMQEEFVPLMNDLLVEMRQELQMFDNMDDLKQQFPMLLKEMETRLGSKLSDQNTKLVKVYQDISKLILNLPSNAEMETRLGSKLSDQNTKLVKVYQDISKLILNLPSNADIEKMMKYRWNDIDETKAGFAPDGEAILEAIKELETLLLSKMDSNSPVLENEVEFFCPNNTMEQPVALFEQVTSMDVTEDGLVKLVTLFMGLACFGQLLWKILR